MKRSEIKKDAILFYSRHRDVRSVGEGRKVRVLDAEGRYKERTYPSAYDTEMCVQVSNARVYGVKVVRIGEDGQPLGKPFSAQPGQLHGDYDATVAELTEQFARDREVRLQQEREAEVRSYARREVLDDGRDLGLRPAAAIRYEDKVVLSVPEFMAMVAALRDAGWEYDQDLGTATYESLLAKHRSLLV